MASKIAIRGGFAKRREWESTGIAVERRAERHGAGGACEEPVRSGADRDRTGDLLLAKPLR
jgi:hypothetical protein